MGQQIERFSPKDWTSDTRHLTLPAKGAWIDILCALWGSATRGALTLTVSEWARVMGCTKDEAVSVINELVMQKVMEVYAEPPLKLPLLSSLKIAVRISSRRILREEEKKQKNRDRVTQFRKESPVDDVWIAGLKANPAYSHLHIDDEIGKMQAWLTTEYAKRLGRTLNRAFVLNWLNKIPKPDQPTHKTTKPQPLTFRHLTAHPATEETPEAREARLKAVAAIGKLMGRSGSTQLVD